MDCPNINAHININQLYIHWHWCDWCVYESKLDISKNAAIYLGIYNASFTFDNVNSDEACLMRSIARLRSTESNVSLMILSIVFKITTLWSKESCQKKWKVKVSIYMVSMNIEQAQCENCNRLTPVTCN